MVPSLICRVCPVRAPHTFPAPSLIAGSLWLYLNLGKVFICARPVHPQGLSHISRPLSPGGPVHTWPCTWWVCAAVSPFTPLCHGLGRVRTPRTHLLSGWCMYLDTFEKFCPNSRTPVCHQEAPPFGHILQQPCKLLFLVCVMSMWRYARGINQSHHNI